MTPKQKSYTPKIFTPRNEASGLGITTSPRAANAKFWRWGDDNLFPRALALMSRRSTIHRRIINDKADYITGKGFNFADGLPALAAFTERVNGSGETLRQLINKLALDKLIFGNAFAEIVTDESKSFLALFHHDASMCRVARDDKYILLHHDWAHFTQADMADVALYPDFSRGADGNLHSMIHFKDYEPMYRNYGVPAYIAGLNVSAIAYKTDMWNISRLDNSFQLSGVMMLDGGVDNEEQADEIVRKAERKFAGQPGQVMFMIKDMTGGDSSRYIPISSDNDGDWKALHDQSTSDIIVAHSWFRSLSGMEYSSSFSSERILHEYEVALNTVILEEQADLLEPLKVVMSSLLGEDCSSLAIVNKPPMRSKPLYMKVWEARRADGLDYDPENEKEQLYVAQITKYAMRNID